MPLYEYRCQACGGRFEKIQKFSDPPPDACAKCGKGPVERLQSSPAIQFKGTGWYITDYSQKGKAGSDSGGGSGSSDGKTAGSSSSEGGTKSDTAAKTDAGTKSESTTTPSKSSSDT